MKHNLVCFSQILSHTQVRFTSNNESAYLHVNVNLHIHHVGGFEHHFSSNEVYIHLYVGQSAVSQNMKHNLLFAPVRW